MYLHHHSKERVCTLHLAVLKHQHLPDVLVSDRDGSVCVGLYIVVVVVVEDVALGEVIDGENRCVGHIHPVKIVQDNPVAPVDDVVFLNIGDYVIDAYQLDRVRAVLVRIGEQTVHGHQGEDKIALGDVG